MINKPKWINKEEWKLWTNIVKTENKEVFLAEFIDDPDNQRSYQIARFMLNNWNKIKTDENE